MKPNRKKSLSLALLPLLIFSFTIPLSASASGGGGTNTGTLLQFVESVYAIQGTVVKIVNTPYAVVTAHFAVSHHKNIADVSEVFIRNANDGSSQVFPQNFTIAATISTSGGQDYVVSIPSASYTFELNSTDPNGPDSVSPAVGGGLDDVGVDFSGIPQTSQSQVWGPSTYHAGCFGGSTWTIHGSTFDFGLIWSGPYNFYSYCIDYAWFDMLSARITDNGFGNYYPFSGSYSGSFYTLDFNFPTTFSGHVDWLYFLLVP